MGSTTTKAVLMRKADQAVLAACYLRTNGDPVSAARNCYAEINRACGKQKVKIIGLEVK